MGKTGTVCVKGVGCVSVDEMLNGLSRQASIEPAMTRIAVKIQGVCFFMVASLG